MRIYVLYEFPSKNHFKNVLSHLDTRGPVILVAGHVVIRGVGADRRSGGTQSLVHVLLVGTSDNQGPHTVAALVLGSESIEGGLALFQKKEIITTANRPRKEILAPGQGPSRSRK